jgi:hypothetical protein
MESGDGLRGPCFKQGSCEHAGATIKVEHIEGGDGWPVKSHKTALHGLVSSGAGISKEQDSASAAGRSHGKMTSPPHQEPASWSYMAAVMPTSSSCHRFNFRNIQRQRRRQRSKTVDCPAPDHITPRALLIVAW